LHKQRRVFVEMAAFSVVLFDGLQVYYDWLLNDRIRQLLIRALFLVDSLYLIDFFLKS